MKTWIKRTLIGVFSASLVLGGIAAYSHSAHGAHGGWHGQRWQPMSEQDAAGIKARMIDHAGSRLDLDDAQKARLADLVDRLREQRNALIGSSADPRSELQALMAGNTFDRARAQAWVESMTQTLRAGSPALIDATADFYDSLRPEQQTELRDLMQRGRGWQGRHGRHGRGGWHDDMHDDREDRDERS